MLYSNKLPASCKYSPQMPEPILNDFTTITAVDEKYLPYLKESSKTWRKLSQLIWHNPLIVIYDTLSVKPAQLAFLHDHPGLDVIPWPPKGVTYPTQREKMLTSFMFGAAHYCKTKWWLKCDADAIKLSYGGDWYYADSKEKLDSDVGNVIVGPAWGYTKPATQPDDFDKWMKLAAAPAAFSPLNLHPETPESKRVRHRRYASWLSFHRTSWTQDITKVWHLVKPWTMPVPSQDGSAIFMAMSHGASWATTRPKRFGWTNASRLSKVMSLTEQALDPRQDVGDLHNAALDDLAEQAQELGLGY